MSMIGLHAFRHEGLQHMALDRQREPGHLRHVRSSCRRRPAPACWQPMKPLVVSTPDDPAVVAADAGDLAILDDVDAAAVGAARIAPGDRVMAHGAAAALQQPAHDGEARCCRNSRKGSIAADRRRGRAARHRRRAAAWHCRGGQRHRAAHRNGTRLMMPRCDTMALKLRSCSSPSHSFSDHS